MLDRKCEAAARAPEDGISPAFGEAKVLSLLPLRRSRLLLRLRSLRERMNIIHAKNTSLSKDFLAIRRGKRVAAAASTSESASGLCRQPGNKNWMERPHEIWASIFQGVRKVSAVCRAGCCLFCRSGRRPALFPSKRKRYKVEPYFTTTPKATCWRNYSACQSR